MRVNYAKALGRLRTISVAAAGFIFVTIAGGFILQLCVGAAWYEHAWDTVGKVTAFVLWLLGTSWFHWIGGLSIGFAIGIWLDDLLCRLASAQSNPKAALPTREKGYLDYQIDILKTGADTKRLLERFERRTNWLNARIKKTSQKNMRHGRKSKGTERDFRRSREIAKIAASHCDKYCNDIIETSREFDETTNVFIAAVDWFYNNRPDWRSDAVVATIRSLRDNVSFAISNVAAFAKALRALHGISADLNQSTARTESLLMGYADTMRRLETFCTAIVNAPAAQPTTVASPSPLSPPDSESGT